MATIRLRAIGADEPGYLKQLRRLGHMRRVLLTGAGSDEDIDEIVTFLLQFVTEPIDTAVAADLLWGASMTQFLQMLTEIGGASNSPLAKSE